MTMNNDEVLKLARQCGVKVWQTESSILENKPIRDFATKLLAKDAELIKVISDAHIATQAREAMLVEALKDLLDDTQHKNHNCGDTPEYCPVLRARDVLSNSTEHTERFMAEVKAKALGGSKADNGRGFSLWFSDVRATMCERIIAAVNNASELRTDNELRGGK